MDDGGAWLLVVDDDDDVRDVITLVLGLRGYEVVGARDGLEALQRLRRAARLPFAIILDLRMPRLDGLGFLGEVKKSLPLSRVPVIAVSGDRANAESAKASGAAACLIKPVDLEVLAAEVARFVPPPSHIGA